MARPEAPQVAARQWLKPASAGGRPAAIAIAGALAAAAACAQQVEGLAAADRSLRRNDAMIMLDYQVIRVPGDKPIDLMGLHVHNKVADGLYLGVGAYAPLLKGAYGGFMAFDVGAHLQQPLSSRLFATAGLAAGGGGGGRSIEQSKVLSGTGGFFKGYVGLGYEFAGFSVGANLARMKFNKSAIDGTQTNLFAQFPYSYLTGAHGSRGQALSPADARLAAEGAGENTLALVADNLRQIDPEGSNKGTIRIADLQYSHYFGRDTYGYAALGVGYRGLPIYNQFIGGVGQRVRLSPQVSVLGQLGIGSGGYSPDIIDTGAGLLVYPKVAVEYALTGNLGLAVSAGYLVAPRGTSKNQTFGVALVRHFRSGGESAAISDGGRTATHRAFRLGAFQQTETSVRYRALQRETLQMLGVQADMLVSEHWYLPLQASVAYTAYLGYPGYGELLAGVGYQRSIGPADRWQLFGQLMAGTNVHGPAVKASAGLRYLIDERWSVQASAGRFEARKSAGKRFSANSLALGLDYRFSIPDW
jgi:hypothetical protein